MKTPSRKVYMMELSCACIFTLLGAYLAVMANLGLEPSATVLMVGFGVLGGGHMTANHANGKEHMAKAGNIEDDS